MNITLISLKRLVIILGMLPVTCFAAGPRDDVEGLWASDGSILKIYEAKGQLHATILTIKDAVYSVEEDPERAGETRLDDNNPDESQRSRPIVGIDIFNDFVFEDEEWQGKIYDPESGNTYKSKVRSGEDGQLKIRGYIGLPIFGRTANFDPATSCLPHILEMLAIIENRNICPEPPPSDVD